MRTFDPATDEGEFSPDVSPMAAQPIKPKVPAVGSVPGDPNAPALPGVEPSNMVNLDPNAYAPPPQQMTPEQAVPANSIPQVNNAPIPPPVAPIEPSVTNPNAPTLAGGFERDPMAGLPGGLSGTSGLLGRSYGAPGFEAQSAAQDAADRAKMAGGKVAPNIPSTLPMDASTAGGAQGQVAPALPAVAPSGGVFATPGGKPSSEPATGGPSYSSPSAANAAGAARDPVGYQKWLSEGMAAGRLDASGNPIETAVPASGVQAPAAIPNAQNAQPLPNVPGAPADWTPGATPGTIQTLSGDWTPPTSAASSAPLIASAAGGTMTPQGDAANSMRGYQSSEGGTFGGFGSEYGDNAALMSRIANGDTSAMAEGLNSTDPKVKAAAQSYTMGKGSQGATPQEYSTWQQGQATQATAQKAAALKDAAGSFGTVDTNTGQITDRNTGQVLGNIKDPNFNLDAARATATANAQKSAQQQEDVYVPGAIAQNPADLSGTAKAATTAAALAPTPAPAAAVNPKAANWTAADPALQAKLIASGATAADVGQAPTSATPATPAPAPLPAIAPVAATASGSGPSVTNPNDVGQVASTSGDLTNPADIAKYAATQEKARSDQMAADEAASRALPAVAASAAPYVPPTVASGMGNVAQTATTADNALTNSTLSRAPGADRFKIAQDEWEAATKASDPAYQASLRSAMQKAAAGGALGSGMLQTSLGDYAANRATALDTNKQQLLSEALKGTIADQFQDVGVAQQQQGVQQSQQQQAYNNEVTQQQLQESLTNGSFQRALQQLTAGSTSNPSDTALTLSQIFGGQSSAAGQSLASLLAGLGQKNAAGTTVNVGGQPAATASQGTDWGSLLSQIFQTNNLGGLPTGQAIGGGTGPNNPLAVGG